jgi:spore maturation protein SpmA
VGEHHFNVKTVSPEHPTMNAVLLNCVCVALMGFVDAQTPTTADCIAKVEKKYSSNDRLPRNMLVFLVNGNANKTDNSISCVLSTNST